MKLVMEMDVNFAVIMVKIFTMDFSWSLIMSIDIAIDLSSLSGRIPFAASIFFFGAKIWKQSPKICKKIKAEK